MPAAEQRLSVEHRHPVFGPPRDGATRINPFGWHVFTTGPATAWVWPYPESDDFMLYRIESDERGHGRAVMEAISEWADREHKNGVLICAAGLVAFYTKFGWHVEGNWGVDHMYEMVRLPR